MKEQIIEMLDSSTIIVNEYEDRAIPTTEFNELAEKIVKLLATPAVVGRSELLKAFYLYIDDKWALGMLTDKVDEVIEDFEKSL